MSAGKLVETRDRTNRDRCLLLAWAFTEHLGYRQLTVIWRLRGLLSFFRSSESWGVMDRKAFASSNSPPSPHETASP